MPANTAPQTDGMRMPVISIIMPAFNVARFIAAAIESVLQQTEQRWELLIIDDGSEDATAAIAGGYAKKHPERIFLLQHAALANRGVAASRNLALARARAEFVAFLDADDLWRPEKLARQLAFMNAHPQAALAYARFAVLREDGDNAFLAGLNEYGSALASNRQDAFLAIALGRAHYAFSSVMARRNAVLAIGGFDGNLRFQNEDRLLVAKIAALSGVAACPDTLGDYRAHACAYTARNAAVAPLLFLDLQVRLLRWLRRRQDGCDLARLLAGQMLAGASAINALLDACAAPELRAAAINRLWSFCRLAPAPGWRAVLRLFLAAVGVRRVADRERSSAELAVACRKLTERLARDGISRVALYGAGQHTQRLIQSKNLAAYPVCGILDDYTEQSEFLGLPVHRPASFRLPPQCAVVVSSDTMQTKLFRQARKYGLWPVYLLYCRDYD